jgi:hypothetical protein
MVLDYRPAWSRTGGFWIVVNLGQMIKNPATRRQDAQSAEPRRQRFFWKLMLKRFDDTGVSERPAVGPVSREQSTTDVLVVWKTHGGGTFGPGQTRHPR